MRWMSVFLGRRSASSQSAGVQRPQNFGTVYMRVYSMLNSRDTQWLNSNQILHGDH